MRRNNVSHETRYFRPGFNSELEILELFTAKECPNIMSSKFPAKNPPLSISVINIRFPFLMT